MAKDIQIQDARITSRVLNRPEITHAPALIFNEKYRHVFKTANQKRMGVNY